MGLKSRSDQSRFNPVPLNVVVQQRQPRDGPKRDLFSLRIWGIYEEFVVAVVE